MKRCRWVWQIEVVDLKVFASVEYGCRDVKNNGYRELLGNDRGLEASIRVESSNLTVCQH
jgi:hypothetical protein